MKLRSLLSSLLLAAMAVAVALPTANAWTEVSGDVNVVDPKGFRQGFWRITAHMKKLGPPWMPVQIVEEGSYIDSKPEGLWTTYHQNSQKAAEVMYKRGRREGVTKYFDVQGNLLSASTFVNGVREGTMITFYPDGKKCMEYTWSNGRINGTMKTYYTSGELYEEGTWTNGWFASDYTIYNKDGSVKRVVLP